jgi:hypothetical protein
LVASDIGDSGQDVINSDVGDDYDIFLGVMWARFGSPTRLAQSGTEEEFLRAIARHRSGEPVKVSFLFCAADVSYKSLDGEQFSKVQAFKKKVQDEGCLTRDFVDDASLINSINLILDKFANTWNSNFFDNSTEKLIGDESNYLVSDEEKSQDERGLLDVNEDFEIHNANFIKIIEGWGDKLNHVADQTDATTEGLTEITKFGKPSPELVRGVLGPFTEEMERFGQWCESQMSDLENVMEQLSRDSLLMIDLSKSMDESSEDVRAARDALLTMHQSIEDANKGIIGFADAIEASPKLDKKLNKANRRVVAVHRTLAEKNKVFQNDIALCISELADRLGE